MEIFFNILTPIVNYFIPVIIFNVRREKRKFFYVSLLIFLLLIIGMSFFPFDFSLIPLRILYYFIIAALEIIAVFSSYNVKLIYAVVLGISSYASEHLAHDAMFILVILFKFYPYNWVKYPVALVIYAVIYFFFVRKYPKEEPSVDLKWLIISFFLLSFCIIMNVYILSMVTYDVVMLVCFIYDFIGTFISLVLLTYKGINDSLERKIKAHDEMWKLKREYYTISAENIETLNRTCHDLRHKILAVESGESDYKQRITDELENAINAYEVISDTGNKALDTIFTEKKLYCMKNDIRFKYMADGAKLGFMDTLDIFSVFGNVIENAIESVMKITDKDRRIIDLSVVVHNKILTIREDNYFVGKIEFKDGLPKSGKADSDFHGFGIKSIKRITESYGGQMKIMINEDLFTLIILIPLSANCAEAI